MDCKQCAEELTAFLDGELDAADSEQVRSHLDACASCSDELQSLQETSDFVTSHGRELEPRDGSWNLVRARIMSENMLVPSRSWFTGRWRVALATLAVCAALVFGYMQYQQIQKKNLDGYISQYMKERESRIRADTVLTGTEMNQQVENPYANNPFIEVKASVTDNPFRSEAQ